MKTQKFFGEGTKKCFRAKSEKRRPKIRVSGGILLLLCCILLISVLAQGAEQKTVRVGYVERKGYHAVDEQGRHSGYDVEYLKKIAEITGWDYEYVGGSWEECLQWIKEGKIDLLGGVSHVKERESFLRLSCTPSLYVSTCLLQLTDQKDLSYEDFEGFDGMTVGIISSSSTQTDLQKYAAENNFTYKLKIYSTEEQLQEAMRLREVDCACLTDNRDMSEYSILAYFNFTQLYYATNLNKPELGDELDQALQRIHAADPYYEIALKQEHYSPAHNLAFTEAERKYIKQKEPIPVYLYMDVGRLFCRYNEETGGYSGIVIDSMERLSERTGLKFDYRELPEGVHPKDFLKEHADVIVVPAMLNSLITYNGECRFLDPIIAGKMVTVSKIGTAIDIEKEMRVAVPEGLLSQEEKLSEIYPNADFVACKDHRDGLSMVKSNKVDFAVVNEFTATYNLQSPYYEHLKINNAVDITENFTAALHPDSDPELISVLQKGLKTFTSYDTYEILVRNTAGIPYDMSMGEEIYRYRYQLVSYTVLLVGLIFFLEQRWKNKKLLQEEMNRKIKEEERQKSDALYREKLFRIANFDTLTGLYSIEYFVEKVTQMIEKQPEKGYTFFRIDIEQFSMINEIYGFDAGDVVLKFVGNTFRQLIGKNGIYARIYADEFAVCLPLDKVMQYETFNRYIRYVRYKEMEIRIQLKIGIYTVRDGEVNVAQALDYAKLAMLHNAARTDEHVFYYKEEYIEEMRAKQKITSEMEGALRDGQFKMYLQPQIDIENQKVVGAEALIRWIHPVDGLIPPNQFIPVMEANGFIYQLDCYMCEQACALLAKWRKNGKWIPISINLSRVDLEEEGLVDMLCGNLKKYDVPAECLHLEITESFCTDNSGKVIEVIRQLRQAGFRVEMDDFGSGESSLSMLKDIPLDILKLDMKFLEGETQMSRGGTIIESIVKLAHSLNIMIIAEGVETVQDVSFLQEIHCTVAQGYLFSKPMPQEEFEEYLETQEVSQKKLHPAEARKVNGRYWKMQQYDLFLQRERCGVFDYDVENDYALFIYPRENGMRTEREYDNFLKKMDSNAIIHPEDRKKVEDILKDCSKEFNKLRFRADFASKNTFDTYCAECYYYRHKGIQTRVIAIIQKEE